MTERESIFYQFFWNFENKHPVSRGLIKAIVEISKMSKEELIEAVLLQGFENSSRDKSLLEANEEIEKLKSQIKKLKASAKKKPKKK